MKKAGLKKPAKLLNRGIFLFFQKKTKSKDENQGKTG